MKNKTVIGITLLASALSLLAVGVDAQRGRRGRRGGGAATAAPQAAPQSAAIAQSLGELRWGSTPEEVNNHFRRQIEERYRPRIAKAPGAIEEDRLRADMTDEIRRLRESYVRFEGTRTGWDLSFLRGEFTHGNRESMLSLRDGNSQNYYFFMRGRLWKWFKAFDASVFHGQTFEQFAGAVQGRFGPAADRSGRLVEGGPNQRWLEWQDTSTRLRAIDHNQFYGFYCLVFEDKGVLNRLSELRTNTQQPSGQGDHSLVDAILLPEGGSDSAAAANPNSDIADRITGNIRRRQQAPEGAATTNRGGASGGGASGSSGSGSSSSGSSGRGSSGGGLDLSDL